MADLKTYDIIDLNPIREYILREGETREMKKGEYLIRAGDSVKEVGIIIDGYFGYMHIDCRGENQIISLATKNEFLSNFISMPGLRSAFDIQALCTSQIIATKYDALMNYMKSTLPENTLQNLYYAIAFGLMTRGFSFRCDSPEMRYTELLQRMPDILQRVPMKVIASYLGITREHFSRMRKRMLK